MPFASVLKQFKKTKRRAKSSTNSSLGDTIGNTSELSNSLDVIGQNSMALPVIMRDINVMKQGILKLVRAATGRAQADRADKFFQTSSDREKSYESQIAASKSTSPTKVGGDKKDGKGFFGTANDFLNAIISGGITNMLIKGGLIMGILYAIGKFFTSSEFRKGVFDMIGKFGQTVFGEEGWKDVKKNIAYGAVILLGAYVGLKTVLSLVSAGLASLAKKLFTMSALSPAGGLGLAGGFGKIANILRVAAGGLLGYETYKAFTGNEESSSGAGGLAAAAAGAGGVSVLNKFLGNSSTPAAAVTPTTEPAKTTPARNERARLAQEQNAGLRTPTSPTETAPTSKWGKFLKFVERKSPKLWGKIGVRLASAATLSAIPVAGWVMAAIDLGLAFWTAWELFELWQEFTGAKDKSPEKVKNKTENEFDIGGYLSQLQNSPGISLSNNVTPNYYKNAGVTPPTRMGNTTSNSGASAGNGGVTFNQLSREQQDKLLAEQRKQEGFRPGTISYDLNNPGNIQYSEKAKKFGGVRDTTGRGDAQHKGTFAKFPTLEDGIEAQRDLWSRKYGDVPIQQALKSWAPYAGANYSQNIISAATSENKPTTSVAVTPAVTKPSSGTRLNEMTSQLNTTREESSRAPVVINAPTTNNNNAGAGGNINLPASGVIDTELAKLLVERAIG